MKTDKNHGLLFIVVFLTTLLTVFSFQADFVSAEGEKEVSDSAGGSAANIQQYLQEALPPNEGRKVVYDDITGVITLTDTPSNQEMAKELIKMWDTGPSQVKIQARFVEIDITGIEELGVQWRWKTDNRTKDNHRFSNTGVNAVSPSISESATASADWAQANETSGLGLDIGQYTQAGSILSVYLKALIEQNKANLLSAPSVTTLSGQMANIQMANVVPYASDFTRTNIGSTFWPVMVEIYKVSEKVTGISLEVTPTVAGDSKIITMDIHPEVSVLVDQLPISSSTDFPPGLGYPVIDTRTTQTSVVLKSGETVVLGGLIREDEVTTNKKTPFLGDIPILGNLFKSKHVNKVKRNLVIFLTATILDSRGEPII